MIRPFMDPSYEPEDTSAKLVYSGTRLDRLSEEREEDCVQTALQHPDALAMGFARGRVLLSFADADKPQSLFPVGELEKFAPKSEQMIFLGYDNGAPRLAVPLGLNPDEEDFSLPEPFKAIDYRSLAVQGLMDQQTFAIVAYGGSQLVWHATNRFCSKCGNPTELRIGGAKRKCTSCEKEHFPRLDPVVIMLTVSGDKCLLGRSNHFPPGMYSELAGFVEQGETLEGAVRRETFEESGIRVGNVTYHASQPWPFPASLMFGCAGEALGRDITIDPVEIEDALWVTREEMMEIFAGNHDKILPARKGAIAHFLLEHWLKDRLE